MDDVYNTKDEDVWMAYMYALAGNPELTGNTVEEDANTADDFLHEFKKRFRD